MKYELYIFNKILSRDTELARWDNQEAFENRINVEILYSSNKFKARRNDLPLLNDFLTKLSQQFRENPKLMVFFRDYFNSSIYVDLCEDYHHLLIYEPSSRKLLIDSDFNPALSPIYLFAFYFYLARSLANLSEDQIYLQAPDFFLAFEPQHIEALKTALDDDYRGGRQYDAGRYFYQWLNKLSANSQLNYKHTQLLRNRSLAGKLPYRLERYEEITELYQEQTLGCFGGQAIEAYYETLKEDLKLGIKELPAYYENLCLALKSLGLQIVSQRGSRVAHEQGPILINSASIAINTDLELEIKKLRSNLISTTVKISERLLEDLKLQINLDEFSLDFDIYLDELLYLSNRAEAPKARYEKVLIQLDKLLEKYFQNIYSALRKDLVDTNSIFSSYDEVRELERSLLHSLLDLRDLLHSSPEQKQCAVIFVQRASSRSGHFIPRILLGENLYVETDSESEEQRLKALPFNFVSPEFSYISSFVDSFFENASISIVTDKDSGKPDIKWSNAEDLAISLAPDFYKAILNPDRRFHYQLETTLIGPLIDLFRYLLEYEISNIASISAAEALDELKALNQSYLDEIRRGTEFCLSYYLLDDYVEEYMLREGCSPEQAIYDTLAQLSDVQKDVAAYCLAARKLGSTEELEKFKREQDTQLSYSARAKAISKHLQSFSTKDEIKDFIKKYIRYPESTARKELLASNKKYPRIIVTSDKANPDADYYYDFTVAPSRIDFGKHVVASVTTLMGRMLGADDLESLSLGKHYIDLVSKARNSLFETSSEAGSAKVAENSCRAVQYAKAISFQAMFQSLGCDGQAIRATINTRDNKAVGLHVMEHGTMASTGYCITKEPLFIILALSLDSEELLSKLGIHEASARQELRSLIETILLRKTEFISSLDWQLYAYESISSSPIIQRYLSDPELTWLPNIYALTNLCKQLGSDSDSEAQKQYSIVASKLIEYSRLLNETGIIQRIQIMNDAIRRALIYQGSTLTAAEAYPQLSIAFNAAYKGNVSDERENANQYLIALLLHESQYLKNASEPSISKLLEQQFQNYPLPQEIRICDPLVDPDVFMGGELKARAEACQQKLLTLFNNSISLECIQASAKTHGSSILEWPSVKRRLRELSEADYNNIITQFESLESSLKYYELYQKGFYKDPLRGYQAVDVIHLNAEHDEIVEFTQDLVMLRKVMRCRKPQSLLILIDNPQQGKKPFLDYDKSLEWLALGGTIGSHMISADRYEDWRREILQESNWARRFINKVILQNQAKLSDNADLSELRTLDQELDNEFQTRLKFIDIRRDFINEKYQQAKEMSADIKTLRRYKEILEGLSKISSYKNIQEIDFRDWLILGGRWLLNGQNKENIEYILNLFDESQELSNISKKAHELLNLFVSHERMIPLEQNLRLVVNAGSTKEADLIISSAADSLEFRAAEAQNSKLISIRLKAYREATLSLDPNLPLGELVRLWNEESNTYEQNFLNLEQASKHLGLMLCLSEQVCLRLLELAKILNKESKQILFAFSNQKQASEDLLKELFGDHRHHSGLFGDLANRLKGEAEFSYLSELGKMLYYNYLAIATLNLKDDNDTINILSAFFDQYLNVHEEDYPPYMFHKLCAGEAFGFNANYFMSPNLREKMFKLAHDSGLKIYKLLYLLISKRTVLKQSSREYRDALIGDHDNGIIPIGYQHETLCLEERMWDCMRALRNFVRNYHDRHPLPIIIKGKDAKVSKLFPSQSGSYVWVAGLSNPGKHSWDLNCVIRSPLLRQKPLIKDGQEYTVISAFTPYLGPKAEIKQIYTALEPNLLEGLSFISPYPDGHYDLNSESFVHALILLEEDKLPRANITMSAHSHPQYISMQTLDWAIPEAWSFLSMRQMYLKTELSQILAKAEIESLSQIEFYEKEFDSIESILKEIPLRLAKSKCEHLDAWILKASKDSGGRGISNQLSLSQDLQQMAEFIYHKTRTDDVVMQEFVPNNARSFTNPEFMELIQNKFVEQGIAIEQICPYEKMFFAMRCFQSLSGIKGYLFSVNIGSATVNAGQGAKMFYGEPIHIMPLYFASKVQKLMDDCGEAVLKVAIPEHALDFASRNNLKVTQNGDFSNRYMLNGLFDYIPYFYILDSGRKYKIIVEDNSSGGLSYHYIKNGKSIPLCSGEDLASSHAQLEELMKNSDLEIDLGLAVIELNSGLGQANLLQAAIEEMCPENRDLFLEWSLDLAMVGLGSEVLK